MRRRQRSRSPKSRHWSLAFQAQPGRGRAPWAGSHASGRRPGAWLERVGRPTTVALAAGATAWSGGRPVPTRVSNRPPRRRRARRRQRRRRSSASGTSRAWSADSAHDHPGVAPAALLSTYPSVPQTHANSPRVGRSTIDDGDARAKGEGESRRGRTHESPCCDLPWQAAFICSNSCSMASARSRVHAPYSTSEECGTMSPFARIASMSATSRMRLRPSAAPHRTIHVSCSRLTTSLRPSGVVLRHSYINEGFDPRAG